ncbi:hypothetical protein Tsubulata_034550 [Turnera subulata]|uniref:Uncharacterized protein n=1 Tax=Turnera subulata TaxID=218843 RepID=A0A9Q0FI73_9ROSI|nr:hypothetical protein Tsubulata_034550 [Turnera subulata]
MSFNRKNNQYLRFLFKLFAIVFIISGTLQLTAAARVLHGEQWLNGHFQPIEQSLQRGPVPPSGHSKIGHEGASLDGMDFAGHRANHPPPPALLLLC